MNLPINFNALLVSSFIPLAIGLVWYSPLMFGLTYKNILGDWGRNLHKKSVALMISSVIFGFLIAFNLSSITIHQLGTSSSLLNEPGFKEGQGEAFELLKLYMEKYGNNFRSFGHGALHGALSAITYIMPILGLITLREGRGLKYFLIHAGYWLVCLVIMGGIICGWLPK